MKQQWAAFNRQDVDYDRLSRALDSLLEDICFADWAAEILEEFDEELATAH